MLFLLWLPATACRSLLLAALQGGWRSYSCNPRTDVGPLSGFCSLVLRLEEAPIQSEDSTFGMITALFDGKVYRDKPTTAMV